MKTQHPANLESLLEQLQPTVGLMIKTKIQVKPILNLKWFQQISTDAINTTNQETICNKDLFAERSFTNRAADTQHPFVHFAPPNSNDCGWIFFLYPLYVV